MSLPSAGVLDREGILELGFKALDDLIENPPQGSDVMQCSIRMTSGTSGRAPIVLATDHKEGNVLGFRNAKTVVIAQGGNNARVGNTLFTWTNAQEPTRVLAVDESDFVPELGFLLQDLEPDALRGFPSFMRRAGEYLGDKKKSVQAMIITGEKWTPALREDFARTFPNARCKVVYAIVEVGVVATCDCPFLLPDHYHPVDDAIVEIGDPDESGIGDVLITRSFFRVFAPQRYQVGDMGRAASEPCTCGRYTFELLGRRGSDFLKVAGAVIFREELDRVAALCKDLFDDFRVEIARRMEDGIERGHIDLSVFRRDGKWSSDIESEIARRFASELFLTRTRTLENLIAEGYFDPLTITRREEPFPFKSKAVKLSERRVS